MKKSSACAQHRPYFGHFKKNPIDFRTMEQEVLNLIKFYKISFFHKIFFYEKEIEKQM